MTIKEHIAGCVEFQFYLDGNLWYLTSETNFLFPVPISDCGNARFFARDKGIMFMRYIRKHMNEIRKNEEIQ